MSRKSGFKWTRCARKGCDQIFEQTTRCQKLYHSPDCAHLQAVNDYNARQKGKVRKPITKKPNRR
jgi:hypothetical protein